MAEIKAKFWVTGLGLMACAHGQEGGGQLCPARQGEDEGFGVPIPGDDLRLGEWVLVIEIEAEAVLEFLHEGIFHNEFLELLPGRKRDLGLGECFIFFLHGYGEL